MMKNSSLLKWTNNKNNKNKNANKNWIHPQEAIQGGHVVYLVKFLGSTEVSQSKGIEVVKEAITKLRFTQQIKKTEGTKTPKVELTISVDGVAIQQPKSKKILFQYPLHQISYCADDKAEKRFFSFIAKEDTDQDVHTCFVFVSDKLAEEITLTIGQAFDLAYRRFLETSNREEKMRRQLMIIKSQLQSIQAENNTLKERLTTLASLKDRDELGMYMQENRISDLLFVNGTTTQVTEEPILHTPPTQSPSQDLTHTSILPPVPPRNNSIKADIIEDQETSEDDFDFDPRAGEGEQNSQSGLRSSPGQAPVIGNGSASPASNEMTSDDDFDPRAEEADSRPLGGGFEVRPQPLQLNGIANFPTLVPPPRPSRQQDKLIPTNLLEGDRDPFSSPTQGSDLLTQFDQMKVGFSRGLSFGTADNDFTLESLDPLKN